MPPSNAPVHLSAATAASFRPDQISVQVVFSSQGHFHGVLIGFEPGQTVPVHVHEHKDEIFDVVEGRGTIFLGDQQIDGGPGTLVCVPAGTPHGFHNDSPNRWIVRETAYDRVYARMAVRMVLAALLRRIRRVFGG